MIITTSIVVVPTWLVRLCKVTKELIAYARANPGKVSFGSSGNGSATDLTSKLLKSLTKTYMVHIPYRGAVPVLTDLMDGQISQR